MKAGKRIENRECREQRVENAGESKERRKGETNSTVDDTLKCLQVPEEDMKSIDEDINHINKQNLIYQQIHWTAKLVALMPSGYPSLILLILHSILNSWELLIDINKY